MTTLDDLALFRSIADVLRAARLAGVPVPDEVDAGVWERQKAARRRAQAIGDWFFVREGESAYRVGRQGEAGQTLLTEAVGVKVLALAIERPNRWVPLDGDRTHRAWHAAIERGLETVAKIDLDLANSLAFIRGRTGAGMRLLTDEREGWTAGWVWARWTPPSGVHIASTVTSP